MSTFQKPPLPSYTVTTVRESFGNLGCSKSITQEAEALNAERSKILSNYYKEFYNYKIRKKKH